MGSYVTALALAGATGSVNAMLDYSSLRHYETVRHIITDDIGWQIYHVTIIDNIVMVARHSRWRATPVTPRC